jgi:hypothetical protein
MDASKSGAANRTVVKKEPKNFFPFRPESAPGAWARLRPTVKKVLAHPVFRGDARFRFQPASENTRRDAKEGCSFLKKRTKKLLLIRVMSLSQALEPDSAPH